LDPAILIVVPTAREDAARVNLKPDSGKQVTISSSTEKAASGYASGQRTV
jgi:hypothetical protein